MFELAANPACVAVGDVPKIQNPEIMAFMWRTQAFQPKLLLWESELSGLQLVINPPRVRVVNREHLSV